MTQDIGSGTAQGVVDYLDSLVGKGRARVGVVTPLKTALTKVLEKTEGDKWRSIDVTKLDVDDAVLRFKNLTLGTYTDASYRAYELRVKRAIKWYEQFLENPGWYPKESTPTKTNGKNSEVSKSQSSVPASRAQDDSETHEIDPVDEPQERSRRGQVDDELPTMSYPFPLQSGETARIYMPMSVTKADVRRLSAFLEALVIEPVKSEATGE